jgi:hypothetical protein
MLKADIFCSVDLKLTEHKNVNIVRCLFNQSSVSFVLEIRTFKLFE